MKLKITRHLLLLILSLAYVALPAQNQIFGTIHYHDNESNPIYNVDVELVDNTNNVVATAVTNYNGEYEFTNIPNGEFIIVPDANLPVGNIDLVDASLILQYLLGITTLNDYQFDAADVNNSGSVTFTDYMLVLIGYILQGTPFPTDEWQFEQLTVNFNQRDSETYDTVQSYGTSTGDVEGIWMPMGRNLVEADSEFNESEITEEYSAVTIGTDYQGDISGYNLSLIYPNKFIQIENITGIDENIHYEINEEQGIIKIAWLDETPENKTTGEELFTINVKAINNTNIEGSQPFYLYESSMVLDTKSNVIEDISIQLPKITTAINNEDYEFSVTSYPNPTIDILNVEITSPIDDIANMSIYDINGRLINAQNNIVITKGTQTIPTNTQNLKPGNYLFMITLNNNNTIRGRFSKAN